MFRTALQGFVTFHPLEAGPLGYSALFVNLVLFVKFFAGGKPWIQLVLELVQWLVWVGSMVQADLVHCLFD